MDINEPVAIFKVKNGFFLHSMKDDIFDLEDGIVFEKFFDLLSYLDGHFPQEPSKAKVGTVHLE